MAFLRQMVKPVRVQSPGKDHAGPGNESPDMPGGCIEVDLEDIRIANRLTHEVLGHSLEELSRPARDLLLLLDRMVTGRVRATRQEPETTDAGPRAVVREDMVFTRREIREHAGWSNARVHRYLRELVDLEYVLVVSGRNGATYRYRLAYDGEGADGARFLLGLTLVEDLVPVEEPARRAES